MNKVQEDDSNDSSFAFDKGIKVEYKGNVNGISLYVGHCGEEWKVGSIIQGGYLISMILNAFTHHFRNIHPHPIHISAHFLDSSMVGSCVIEIRDVKSGKKSSIAYAILKQPKNDDGEGHAERIHATVMFGDLNGEEGISQPYFDPIPLPNKTNCELLRLPTFVGMHNHLKVLSDVPIRNSKRAEVRNWMKFSDERKLDIISLGMFSDLMFPPPTQYLEEILGRFCWYPTLTLEIQFKSLPKGQWIASSFRSRFLNNGRNEIDGELWDDEGNLLCITRHMCLTVPEKDNPKHRL